MYFLVRPETDTYITIHREDVGYFREIVNSGTVFTKENKFRLVTEKADIKKILEDRYSSKNRTEEYTCGLPSATLISSALFPYNLDTKAPHNKVALLKWHNDIEVADCQSQKITNKLSTDSGTMLHEILEFAIKDRDTRLFEKTRNLDKYIEMVCADKHIQDMIENFDDRKQYFVEMARKTLGKFFAEEIGKIDPVFNEIFLKNKGIQGAIDLLCYKNKKLYLSDFKTSKKSMSYNQVADKGYLRQLYIYSRMLLNLGIISKKEYDNLEFQIYFFNWNSGKSAVYEFPKKEIDKSKGYVEFILQWYFDMKDMGLSVKEVL